MICFNDPTEQPRAKVYGKSMLDSLLSQNFHPITPCHYVAMKKMLPSGEWDYGMFCTICGAKKPL